MLASCDPKFLDDAVNQDNQGHGLEIRIATATAGAAPLTLLAEHNSWQGEVLTVWRRLHIERDSMAALVSIAALVWLGIDSLRRPVRHQLVHLYKISAS